MYKSRLIYLAILIASFIFSQALYESVAFMTFIVILMLPLVSVFLALISYAALSIDFDSRSRSVFRFDDFLIKISVRNYSPFISPSICINCSMPDDDGIKIEKVSFMANASVGMGGSFDYIRSFANRRIYKLSIDSAEYYDFLKLIRIKKKISKTVYVRSKPRNIELGLPVISDQQKQENSMFVGNALVNRGGDMFGVKEYAYGDSMKNVHWKLSAKSDELVVKTFAENIYEKAIVIADMSAYYESDVKSRAMTDCIAEAALSAIRSYYASAVNFRLIFNVAKNQNSQFLISSASELFDAQGAIAMTPMVPDTSVTDILRNVDFDAVSGCEVCIITSFASDDMLKNIKKMFIDKKSGLRVIRISEYEAFEKDGVLSYTREFIERRCKNKVDETF